jgi:hypothetical protein
MQSVAVSVTQVPVLHVSPSAQSGAESHDPPAPTLSTQTPW